MDYRKYRCNAWDYLKCLGISAVIAALVAWLFYHSWYALILTLPIDLLCQKKYKRQCIKKRKEMLLLQFKDGMQAVSAALVSGYSVENAWGEAERELVKLHGEKALMTEEFHGMNAGIKMNQQIEKLLAEFAVRSGCEDIESFAEVFGFAKRSGGDFVKIIRTTITKMTGKIEVEREIATVIAGKKMEGRIMDVMPIFILAYMNLTSKEFLAVLYGNTFGILLMSAALVVYMLTIKFSEYIMDIHV